MTFQFLNTFVCVSLAINYIKFASFCLHPSCFSLTVLRRVLNSRGGATPMQTKWIKHDLGVPYFGEYGVKSAGKCSQRSGLAIYIYIYKKYRYTYILYT